MLEHYYKERRSLVDFRRGPLGPYFDGFAAYLKTRGYAHHRIKTILGRCCLFNTYLTDQGITTCHRVTHSLIEPFLNLYQPGAQRRSHYVIWMDTQRAVKHFFAYLVSVGVLTPDRPKPVVTSYSWVLEPYLTSLREEGERTEQTLQRIRGQLSQFLDGLGVTVTRQYLKGLKAETFEAMVKQYLDTSPDNLRRLASTLRGFLQFCAQRRYTTMDFSSMIPRVPTYRLAALPPVQDAMDDPMTTKTITLSCGKLTTGVTVKPWTGILMLRNSSSPETYFQAAFRVQSPWTVANPDGATPNEQQIIKEECYVFDFAPDRALRQIADYSCRLNVNEVSPEKKVEEFISFLPVLAYDGSSMKQVDAAGILDMAMSGTTATLLARRWESALLVNVDNGTLRRLMDNKKAMEALMSIEGFRNLNQEIETIINKSDAVKKARKEANDEELSTQKKRELTAEEKKYKSLRKQIQEKLIKFATRIPIFMYLTDYRERTLKDVITQLEPGLFRKVTGLTVKDFELLVSLGIFNSPLLNDAVYKFKRYEDSSLSYTGINKHEGEDVGLYDTVLSRRDYEATFVNEPIQAYQSTKRTR